MDWFLARMKAWMAIAVPALATTIMKSFEQAMGFDIPTEIEVIIVSFLTGLVVHQVPNKVV
jgi:hypothetical protein